MQKRNDLQILRGLAVLLVVLYHFKVAGFSRGFLGVDIFFVISGYLMALLYDKGTVREFYKRRIDRLLPAYVFVIVASSIVGYWLLIPIEFNQLYEQALAGIFFVNNFQFWLQDSYFSSSAFNPLLNLWSLSVEVQFYLIVPFIYLMIRNKPKVFILVFVLSFVSCLVVLLVSPKTAFFMMPFRIWEFMAGAYVAWKARPAGSVGVGFQWAALLLLIAAVVLYPLEPNTKSVALGHPGLASLLVVCLAAVIIYIGLPLNLERGLIGRSMRRLGDISYSVYLVHFPIIVFWNYLEFGGTNLYYSSLLDLGLMLCLTLGLALLLYVFIETRFAHYFRSGAVRAALILSILPIVILASELNKKRFTNEQIAIFSGVTDVTEFRCGKLYPYLNPSAVSCNLGVENLPKRVMLVGNSHADAIKESFTRIANRNDYSVSFLVSNQPLLDRSITVEQIMDSISASQVEALFLHFNAQVYSEPIFKTNLLSLVGLAKSKGIAVVLLEPVPSYETSVPQTAYLATQGDSALSDLLVQQHTFDNSVSNLIGDLSGLGVTTYRLRDVFCSLGEGCRALGYQSQPYYYDAHHLNLTGAAMLEPLFQSAFEKL